MAAALIVALALAPPGGAWAAQAPAVGLLCVAISLDELNGLGPLWFTAAAFGSETSCVFEASATQPGSYSLTLSIRELSFDLMRQASPDLVELTVGDHPASTRSSTPSTWPRSSCPGSRSTAASHH